MEQNQNYVWLVCFVTCLIGLYWSILSLVRDGGVLPIVFLCINVVCTITVALCFAKDRKAKQPTTQESENEQEESL